MEPESRALKWTNLIILKYCWKESQDVMENYYSHYTFEKKICTYFSQVIFQDFFLIEEMFWFTSKVIKE